MNPSQLKQIALNWFDAFNEHDLEKLLSLYDEKAQHFSPKLKVRQPETQGLIQGKTALRAWWKDAFDRLPSLQYKLQVLTIEENRIFMEYERYVAGEEALSVAEKLIVDTHGLIEASRVYHG